MYNFPIGVILESFRTDRSTAIRKAAAIGANGIQMYATKGENSPENLNAAQRRELLDEYLKYVNAKRDRMLREENNQ